MGAGAHGPGTIGHETRPEVLINTWQSMARCLHHRQIDAHHRLPCGHPSARTLTGTACKAIKALCGPRADGADDLDPAWL